MNQLAGSVDNVIDRLSEIEANAVQILDLAEEKKKLLSAGMEREKESFMKKLQLETEEKIKQLRTDMNVQKEEKLAGLEEETKQKIGRMQEEFDRDQKKLTDQVVAAIVKV